MNTKHTPGPWETRRSFATDAFEIRGPAAEGVAQTGIWSNPSYYAEMQANARLIAAAPDMLAALEGLMECEVAACNGCDEYGGFSDRIITPLFDAARAAIARAKGEA